MSYISRFLHSKGQHCTILREPPVESRVSLRKATKSIRDLAARGSYVEGLILADSELSPGEVFTLRGEKYISQNVRYDPSSGELHLFATTANTSLALKRLTETIDNDGNIVKAWEMIDAGVPAFGEIITATLRQTDPGLLSNARYIFQVPESTGVQMDDRAIHNNAPYQIVSVDDLFAPGVVRLQAAVDLRTS